MPSFADSIFLFVLALLLFGPKKLPVLARELGKWMGEFRRASNEFKMQMDEELRASEQADRQKQIAAMEAAAPVPPPLDEPAEPEHPHMRHQYDPAAEPSLLPPTVPSQAATEDVASQPPSPQPAEVHIEPLTAPALAPTTDGVRPIPIATSGSLKMMPPDTGLPTPRGRSNPLASLVDAIPEVPASGTHPAPAVTDSESVAHGD